jgi:hypothetical protein
MTPRGLIFSLAACLASSALTAPPAHAARPNKFASGSLTDRRDGSTDELSNVRVTYETYTRYALTKNPVRRGGKLVFPAKKVKSKHLWIHGDLKGFKNQALFSGTVIAEKKDGTTKVVVVRNGSNTPGLSKELVEVRIGRKGLELDSGRNVIGLKK